MEALRGRRHDTQRAEQNPAFWPHRAAKVHEWGCLQTCFNNERGCPNKHTRVVSGRPYFKYPLTGGLGSCSGWADCLLILNLTPQKPHAHVHCKLLLRKIFFTGSKSSQRMGGKGEGGAIYAVVTPAYACNLQLLGDPKLNARGKLHLEAHQNKGSHFGSPSQAMYQSLATSSCLAG